MFPAGINVGATWDKRLAYERGKAMGLENRDKGITVLLGPVAGGLGRVSLSPTAREDAFSHAYIRSLRKAAETGKASVQILI